MSTEMADAFPKRAHWLQETLIGEMQIIRPHLGAGHNRNGPLPRTSKVQRSSALINHNHRLDRITRGTRSKTTGGKTGGFGVMIRSKESQLCNGRRGITGLKTSSICNSLSPCRHLWISDPFSIEWDLAKSIPLTPIWVLNGAKQTEGKLPPHCAVSKRQPSRSGS